MDLNNENAPIQNASDVQLAPTVPVHPSSNLNKWKPISLLLITVIIGLSCGFFLTGLFQSLQKNVVSTNHTPVQVEVPNEPEEVESVKPTKLIHREKVGTTGNVHAGGLNESIFREYTMQISDGWVVTKHMVDNSRDELVVGNTTNSSYTFSILQAGFGGAGCAFSSDDNLLNSGLYESYVEISDSFRRVLEDKVDLSDNVQYGVCERFQDGLGYGKPTSFGGIVIVAPSPPDEAVLKQIDAMLRTLHKSEE